LEALSYIAADVTPPEGWRAQKLAMLDEAAKPKAEVEFAIIVPVRKLVILAAELRALKGIPSSLWKERVSSLAAGGSS
jgi:hypothetical protein